MLHKIAEAWTSTPRGMGVYRDQHMFESPDGDVMTADSWEPPEALSW